MHSASLLSGVKRVFTASTFRTVMLLFLLLFSFLYAMSLLVYEKSYHLIQENIFSSHQAQIKNDMQVLENDIQYIRSQQLNLVNDFELNTLGFSYDDMSLSDIVFTERSVQEKMNTLCSSSVYVKDATVWFLSSGIAISGKSGVSTMTDEEYEFIRESMEILASPITVHTEKPYMVLLSPYLMDLSARPLRGLDAFALTIQLDLDSFTDTISKGEALYGTQAHLQFGEATAEEEVRAEIGPYLAGEIAKRSNADASGSLHLTYQGTPYVVSYQHSQALDATLLSYTPEENIFSPLHFYRNWLIAFLLFSIFVLAVFSSIVYAIVHKPLRTLLAAFRRVENGKLNAVIEHRGPEEFAYIYEGFNSMISTICRLNNEVSEQTILTQQAELKHLQQKINPHFLYNAFFSISTISMAEGCELASRLSQKLGEYFRFVTKEASENVKLSRELPYARIYAEIQESRFSTRITIQIDELPRPELEALRLPALLLQPLIENALEHGLRNKLSDGIIHVGFQEKGKALTLFVEDNGEELKEEDLIATRQNCVQPRDLITAGALSNLYRRLSIRFGKSGLMRVVRSELGGLRVEIDIPLSDPLEETEKGG